MTLHCQAEFIVGTEAGQLTSYVTCSEATLPDLFDRLLDQIAIDFGNVVPDSITIIISKG